MLNLTEEEQKVYDNFLKIYLWAMTSDYEIFLYLLAKQQVRIDKLEKTLFKNNKIFEKIL
jgi:hypothetical protein